MRYQPIADLVNLVPADGHDLGGMPLAEAEAAVLAADPRRVLELDGSFAIAARDGDRVCLARSLDRPLRYFLAKQEAGPLLVVAERIDDIAHCLAERGQGDQFRPDYTRMAPAHHVTTLRLVGCPDPNPRYARFLEPAAERLPADLDVIAERYVGALLEAVDRWLDRQARDEPIGVLFSGGVDSSSVLVALHQRLLERGESPARLKAFTLSIDGGGSDAEQAREVLRRIGMEYLGETIEVPSGDVDVEEAIAVIEDYKARDVECAAVNLALLAGIRARHPGWTLLVDGDGGDENLKDYPIEENAELTIVSVVNNPLLYQEGWGVDAIKHSLTYSGGYSRGCVRTYAPARRHGFRGFSPYATPGVVATATAIPFSELADGSHERLYALKGEIVRRGLLALTGIDLPVFPKRRFQEGAMEDDGFRALFAGGEERYRAVFRRLHAARGG